MSLIVTTTGTTVEVLELGISIIHPSSLNMTDQFSAEELRRAKSLTIAIRSGSLAWKKTSGGATETATDYDPDYSLIEDLSSGDGLAKDRIATVQQVEVVATAQSTHAGLTNNPHAVTKAQVGLGNADNTSDANKPVSTAQQNALNLKYNASNPNGYETPALLNTRDTNNRARANHTGTQLSSTVSNFAATVRDTVLTGISFASALEVVATDTVMSALGKIQRQFNNFADAFPDAVRGMALTGFSLLNSAAVVAGDSILVAIGKLQRQIDDNVFGEGFEEFINATVFTTTSSSNVVIRSFTTTTKRAGKYRVAVKWNFTTSSGSNSARFHIRVDNTQVDGQMEVELKDTTDDVIANSFVYVNLAAGTHTIALWGNMEGSSSMTISLVRAEIWRVS